MIEKYAFFKNQFILNDYPHNALSLFGGYFAPKLHLFFCFENK